VLSAEYENLLAFRTSLRQFVHWSHSQALAVGLTPAQHQLMVAVKGHPDGKDPAISDLAGYLLLRHHSAVELVDRAEHVGLVERLIDADDRRVVRLSLTPTGRRLLERLSQAHLEELARLTPVVRQLDPSGLATSVDDHVRAHP
jgi:DNA-binding MarR family transcriptional regulator